MSVSPDVGVWKPTRVTRIIRQLGTSTGTLYVATDAGDAYVKTLGNPEGPAALISELVGTRLASWLGLNTFEFSILPFPEELTAEYAKGCSALPGPAFAARAIGGRPWGGNAEDLDLLENPEATSGLVLLDTWIRNCDRYRCRADEIRRNLNNVFFSEETKAGRYRLVAMDHTEAFRCGREYSSKLFGIDQVRDTQVFGLFPGFLESVTRDRMRPFIAQLGRFDSGHAARIVLDIPPEWGLSKEITAAFEGFCVQRAQFVAEHAERWLEEACEWPAELRFPPAKVTT